ncbi:MAG: hypothetical protein WCC03_20075 [Candidatus Acidiferrales bacterium]|jgi:hypothetical protein
MKITLETTAADLCGIGLAMQDILTKAAPDATVYVSFDEKGITIREGSNSALVEATLGPAS